MKDDYGYFGSGLEGYVQYNEAFKRNFDCAAAPENISEDDVSGMGPEDDGSIEDDSDIDFEDEDPIDNEDV